MDRRCPQTLACGSRLTTADLTDDQGDVVDDYTYDVFGAIRSQSGSSDNYWLFTGEQRDSDEDLYYLRARYYDPEIGRFLSQDPLTGSVYNAQTQNRYPYVGGNPTNRIDPSGLMWIAEMNGGVIPKEGGGFGFDRLCPNRDPSHIYAIIAGVCYDITPDPCAGMNPLLCGSGESGLGFLDNVGATIGDIFKPDDSDFLQNRQSSDCGLQFGSWCALDTSLEPLLHSAADNPECVGAVIALGALTTAAILAPPTAPGSGGGGSILLEAAITTCMTER